jgi:PAS domain S-box-containing protein
MATSSPEKISPGRDRINVPCDAVNDRVRILVVDDDERNLLAIKTVLEDTAEVVLAASGEEALRYLLKDEFAVILLDVFMPGIDGYETAQLIRSREQTKRIPIVFLSAVNKESEHLMRGYAMGAVDYVFKPVDPIVIKSKVAVFVDLFAMRREIQRKAVQEQKLLDAALLANTEKLRVEQELRQAEQRQTAILHSLPIMLYMEEADSASRAPQFLAGDIAALTGYAAEQLKETPTLWEERLHPDDRQRVLAVLQTRGKVGKMALEYRWRCANDQYKYFLDQAVRLPGDSDGSERFAGSLLDITERKSLETELTHARKMDAIGKLTGGIAHDFNNLLAAVLGGVGLIERRLPVTEDQRKILTMTRHAAEQGAELVSRLLAFSRRQSLEPARIAIDQLASSVRGLLSHTLGGLVNLEWETNEGLWPAYADASQLELALMNLIINARDAMPHGGTVTVTGKNRSIGENIMSGLAGGDYVVLTVADNGSGIPTAFLDQVLEPFFTTKEIGKGTGLGLSMVYGFAKQSGGSLTIESEVARGTTIDLWLPRAPGSAAAVALAAVKSDANLPAGSLRVLLVDDHPGVRATTAALLVDMGHDVTDFPDARSALAILREKPADFDLLISDYAMPAISGIELICQARQIVDGLRGIIITGYAEASSISSRPEDVQILRKPFGPDQLREMLSIVAEPIGYVKNTKTEAGKAVQMN